MCTTLGAMGLCCAFHYLISPEIRWCIAGDGKLRDIGYIIPRKWASESLSAHKYHSLETWLEAIEIRVGPTDPTNAAARPPVTQGPQMRPAMISSLPDDRLYIAELHVGQNYIPPIHEDMVALYSTWVGQFRSD